MNLQNPVLWQWQSDPDPWAETDPTKMTWQTYSDADCLRIEKAFSLNKGIADLTGYEVDFKRMVQVNKQFKDRMRRVKRLQRSRFLIQMPKPVAIQKTINEAFGTIQHFLDYIMKRTPKAFFLYQRLEELHLDCKANEFRDVIKEVVECIEKGAELKAKSSLPIVNLIKNNSTSLRDFLKSILKAYTMETFLCYWLNELLRNENWEEINLLTPFLVCLVYTFKLSDYIIQYQKPQKSLKNLLTKPKLTLFRGTALTQEHLELYDLKKIKYFSWNGVTSTSRDRNVALKFIQLSLAAPKIGVLFSIETDFASAQDCEGMIDISQSSQFPDEQEVILAPGTVFKIQKTCSLENNLCEINLKVKRKFKKPHKEKILLLGNLQDHCIFKEKAIIDKLPSLQSLKLLPLIRGNKSIRRLEIRDSELDENLMEEIEKVRLTTNVKKQDLTFNSNQIIVGSFSSLAQDFSVQQLEKICLNNKIQFQKTTKNETIKRLTISGFTLWNFHYLNQLTDLWENLGQITDLQILFTEFSRPLDFLGSLKELKCLQNLRFTLNEHQTRSTDGLETLCLTIGSLHTLNQLSLGFSLPDEGFKFLQSPFSSLVTLKNLSLDFTCRNISDQGLAYLKSALIPLRNLQYLLLDFHEGPQISDEGLKQLSMALLKLTSLQCLSVDFSFCDRISGKGLNYLKNVLLSLTSLKHLSLRFDHCNKVSSQAINQLEDGFAHILRPFPSSM